MEGSDGTKKLMVKFRAHGPAVFYHGAMAAFAANLLGHYPWYDTCMIRLLLLLFDVWLVG